MKKTSGKKGEKKIHRRLRFFHCGKVLLPAVTVAAAKIFKRIAKKRVQELLLYVSCIFVRDYDGNIRRQ